MHALENLFHQFTGTMPEGMEALSAAGSNRRYFRLRGGGASVVGVEGTSVEENRAFIAMAKHFHEAGLPVPQVLARSEDDMYYLQEDLGDTTLFDRLAAARLTGTYGEEETALLRRTLQRLPEVQVVGARGFDFSVCYPLAEFNERSVMWDLNYFKYCFLKATGLEFSENRLEDDFQRLAAMLLRTDGDTFMYRDFQSRNVMVKDGEPYFIDFQGGRRGPVHYDVASFLWQARAQYPPRLREELLDAYLQSLARFMPVNGADFRRQLRHFVLFRTLQVVSRISCKASPPRWTTSARCSTAISPNTPTSPTCCGRWRDWNNSAPPHPATRCWSRYAAFPTRKASRRTVRATGAASCSTAAPCTTPAATSNTPASRGWTSPSSTSWSRTGASFASSNMPGHWSMPPWNATKPGASPT